MKVNYIKKQKNSNLEYHDVKSLKELVKNEGHNYAFVAFREGYCPCFLIVDCDVLRRFHNHREYGISPFDDEDLESWTIHAFGVNEYI